MSALALLACLVCLGCRPQPPAKVSAKTDVAGLWDFIPAPRNQADAPERGPSLNAGTQLTLQLGQEQGGKFDGRVQSMLSGDVMVSPNVFAPVNGWTRPGGQIGFTIGLADTIPAAASLSILGEMKTDTIRVTQVTGDAPALSFLAPGTLFVRRAR